MCVPFAACRRESLEDGDDDEKIHWSKNIHSLSAIKTLRFFHCAFLVPPQGQHAINSLIHSFFFSSGAFSLPPMRLALTQFPSHSFPLITRADTHIHQLAQTSFAHPSVRPFRLSSASSARSLPPSLSDSFPLLILFAPCRTLFVSYRLSLFVFAF